MTTEPPLVLVAAVAMLVELADAERPTVSTRLLAHHRRLDRRATSLLVKRLRAAGLVQIVLGPAGGVRLTQPPEAITLHDVVRALAEPVGDARRARTAAVAGRGSPIGPVVVEALASADQQRIEALGRVTIAHLHEEVRRQVQARAKAIRAERRARC